MLRSEMFPKLVVHNICIENDCTLSYTGRINCYTELTVKPATPKRSKDNNAAFIGANSS